MSANPSRAGRHFLQIPGPTNVPDRVLRAIDRPTIDHRGPEFARHNRFAEATRRAARAWGLEILCANPAEYSSTLTALVMPADHDADAFRRIVLDTYDMSLGAGLGKLAGRVFRIGHLGDLNDLTLAGTLAGVEMGLALAGVPHQPRGVQAALDYLADVHAPSKTRPAAVVV